MRMIDRWFPCDAVTMASRQPHGSGLTEKGLFTWFAARPIAQARAAVLTTLLPWPEERSEQRRLQDLVTRAIGGDLSALRDLRSEVRRANPSNSRVLDPFSGRAIIPLEGTRAGAEAWGIDYSPVATLGGMLLADFPFRDWSAEPSLPFSPLTSVQPSAIHDDLGRERLVQDVAGLLSEIGRRYEQELDEFYPKDNAGKRPWGYLWAQTMPCDECKHYFPMVGSATLRTANPRIDDPGACLSFVIDRNTGDLNVVIHEGVDHGTATLLPQSGKRGKVARCPYCKHPHVPDVVKSKANARLLRDRLLVVAELQSGLGPVYRLPTALDLEAIEKAEVALKAEPPFSPGVPAVPHEAIPPGNNDTVRGSLYGAKVYGDLSCMRQTLSFVRLCRIIANLQGELEAAGCSGDYIRALLGYAGSVVVRKLRRSTRGATLDPALRKIDHIFKNQASLNYGFDFFEAGVGDGAGTWRSVATNTLQVLEKLKYDIDAAPARIRQGSALHLPFKPKSIAAIITDPPYYNMIDYSDASDLFFVYLKRALGNVFPELFGVPGVQEKEEEIIVKRGGVAGEHRTAEYYKRSLQDAFTKARAVLLDDGALTVVFGHGDPDAWTLLLSALTEAGFIVTGAWPARTEASVGAGSANIAVTITIACRPAPTERPDGLQATVDLEVEHEIRGRIPDWERDGLALTDQLMAANGPTMEVLGRYARVLRPDGQPVPIEYYLSLGRRIVQDATAIKVDGLPLETFDARTRFALFWARLFGRQLAPKSEATFQAMASNIRLDDVRRDILDESTKGYRLADFGEKHPVTGYDGLNAASASIDIVRHMVRAWRAEGGDGVATVLSLAERTLDDSYLWAVVNDLSNILPPTDKDRKSLEDIIRNRRAIGSARATYDRKRSLDAITQTDIFQDSNFQQAE